MSVTHIGTKAPSKDVLSMLEERANDALARLSALPASVDDITLFSATATWNEARTAFESASAMLGRTIQRQAA